MKKTILILAMLLMVTFPCAMADTEVDIDINGDDILLDVEVNGDELNATVLLNGVDVVKERALMHETLYNFVMSQYYKGQVMDKVNKIEDNHNQLVVELDAILAKIFNNIGWTYHVLGIDHNSTYVIEALNSGDMTVADFLELYREELDRLSDDAGLLFEMQSAGHEVLMEVMEQQEEDYRTLSAELTALSEKQEILTMGVDSLAKIQDGKIDALQEQVDELKTELRNTQIVTAGYLVLSTAAIIAVFIVKRET